MYMDVGGMMIAVFGEACKVIHVCTCVFVFELIYAMVMVSAFIKKSCYIDVCITEYSSLINYHCITESSPFSLS